MEEHNLMEDSELQQDDRTMATLAHLGTFIGMVMPGIGNILVPLIIWLFKGKESDYINRHAKEALNFQITMSILFTIAAIMMIVVIGFVVLPILIVLDVAFSITAAIRANRGEFYDYPLNFRWIK